MHAIYKPHSHLAEGVQEENDDLRLAHAVGKPGLIFDVNIVFFTLR